MRVNPSRLAGACTLLPQIHHDERGWFHEVSRASELRRVGIAEHFVQENHSRSVRGTVRGLHFQYPDPQAKIIRCARGSILDVIVDLRVGSPTFGQFECWMLDDEECAQVYCPVGFAHGFMVTSDIADVIYQCSDYFVPSAQWSLRFDDPHIGIPWPTGPHLVSEKDGAAPGLAEIEEMLPFRWSA